MTTAILTQPAPMLVPRPSLNVRPLVAAVALIAVGTAFLSTSFTGRLSALFLVGVGAGLVLYHAAFGFTSAWRVFIANGRGAGLRAQMLMLALASVVFVPLLASGEVLGQTVRGSVSPIGLGVVFGAFLFGVSMQLGGGCASGTLYTAGGGSVRMLVTLAAFIAGSVAGVWHMPLWERAPSLGPISLLSELGAPAALAASLIVFGAISAVTIIVERRRHGALERSNAQRGGLRAVLRGPWPLAAGAVGLAVVNIATLLLAGRPWGVTSAFALWGSKTAAGLGVDVAAWPYWQSAARAAELRASVFNDVTSVMNFGIILGALVAAAAAGRVAPVWRIPARSLAAAVVGGLMLGYGARIAYGCNIGAYFSGIASSSLHGWLWFAAAFAGNIVGTRLRPLFGLRV